MRRKDKQVINRSEIDAIIRKSKVCRIAMAYQHSPYLVPVCFGYDGNSIFIHTAITGEKIQYFEKNNQICFEFESDVRVIPDDKNPCKWTMSYKTVIGFGTITELNLVNEKIYGLNQIYKQYAGHDWDFQGISLEKLRVWKIDIQRMTGKQSESESFNPLIM